MTTFVVTVIGRVASSLGDLERAPRQPDEGGPDAWLEFDEGVGDALADVRAGADLLVLTWLDRARRDVLRVHPRGDPQRALEGVFTTRSPDRPNPIGLHLVHVIAVDGLRVRVRSLDAVDGTPIIDVKPVLPTDIRLR